MSCTVLLIAPVAPFKPCKHACTIYVDVQFKFLIFKVDSSGKKVSICGPEAAAITACRHGPEYHVAQCNAACCSLAGSAAGMHHIIWCRAAVGTGQTLT